MLACTPPLGEIYLNSQVFVPNNAFDTLKVRIGSCVFVRQHVGSVENIETFVLHGAHVKGIHSYNVVKIQVILEPVLQKNNQKLKPCALCRNRLA